MSHLMLQETLEMTINVLEDYFGALCINLHLCRMCSLLYLHPGLAPLHSRLDYTAAVPETRYPTK